MLHFQISRSSVEIVVSASSVWISLWPVLHQAPLLGHCTAQETPCVEAWPVVSGQWSRRMLSPWTLEDAQRPGEAGVGVRGKRGGHGGEEKDGETVRVVAGGWKGWAGLCRMRGYRSKYCWRVAAARRRRRHWLVTSRDCRGPALYTVQLQHVCRPALLTAATRHQYSHTAGWRSCVQNIRGTKYCGRLQLPCLRLAGVRSVC